MATEKTYDATAGRVMVSTDGEGWETRSQLPMGDFAVDPGDADHLVAMTEQGPGGERRRWTDLDGDRRAPAGVPLLPRAPGAVGRHAGGRDLHAPRCVVETGRSAAGTPPGLMVTEDGLYAAVDQGDATGIHVSSDGGRTWGLRYSDGRP